MTSTIQQSTQLTETRLDRILAHKRLEIAGHMRDVSPAAIRTRAEEAPPARDFYTALATRAADKRNAVIAEIKQASPSKGLLTKDFNPAAIARSYQQGGAACLSVLTDRTFFRGDDQDLILAKNHCTLPVIRKDFILDSYQIYQARSIGADAILLIVAALDNVQLADYQQLAHQLQMAALIEVHDQHELDRALAIKPQMLGINNRNLHNFVTDLKTSEVLAPQALAQGALVVAESGLSKPDDLWRLHDHGVYSFLIGESLITSADREKALQKLLAPRTMPPP